MRILFITSTRIGDVVLSTGLLDHLIRTHPGARIWVACGPGAMGVFRGAPGVERVLPMPKQRRGLHWLALWRQVAAQVWDLVVDLRASAIAWMLIARRRRVLTPASRGAAEHRVIQLGRVLDLDPPPAPRLWPEEIEQATAARLVPAPGVALAVGPTANWGGKAWPAERFVALVERLTGPAGPMAEAPVVVIAGPGEREAALPVLASVALARRVDLIDRVDLATASAVLARCRLYVGNDSGLMHLAAASGVPTLGLFGPSREVHYAPWGPRCASVRGTRTYEDIIGAPGYDYRSHATHMGSLCVDAVDGAARDLLAATADPQGDAA